MPPQIEKHRIRQIHRPLQDKSKRLPKPRMNPPPVNLWNPPPSVTPISHNEKKSRNGIAPKPICSPLEAHDKEFCCSPKTTCLPSSSFLSIPLANSNLAITVTWYLERIFNWRTLNQKIHFPLEWKALMEWNWRVNIQTPRWMPSYCPSCEWGAQLRLPD